MDMPGTPMPIGKSNAMPGLSAPVDEADGAILNSSFMIPELGLYSLVLAAAWLSLPVLPVWRRQVSQSSAVGVVYNRWAMRFCALAFIALVWSFAVDDFSVAYV